MLFCEPPVSLRKLVTGPSPGSASCAPIHSWRCGQFRRPPSSSRSAMVGQLVGTGATPATPCAGSAARPHRGALLGERPGALLRVLAAGHDRRLLAQRGHVDAEEVARVE